MRPQNYFEELNVVVSESPVLYIPFAPVFAVYCTVLFSACITEKKLLSSLSTLGPYLTPGFEDLFEDLYVINTLGFGD